MLRLQVVTTFLSFTSQHLHLVFVSLKYKHVSVDVEVRHQVQSGQCRLETVRTVIGQLALHNSDVYCNHSLHCHATVNYFITVNTISLILYLFIRHCCW